MIVVNNANRDEVVQSISRICAEILGDRGVEVNKYSWPRFRSDLIRRWGANIDLRSLFRFELGLPGWNVHHARNVGMVLARVICPESEYILNFDSDICIPESLVIDNEDLMDLTCLKINGTPDLSRLEWMALYALFVNKKYAITGVYEGQPYCRILAETLPVENLATIIHHGSDFPANSVHSGEEWFPTREEYHGACYIVSKHRIEMCPFPAWYDNDWFVFRTWRRRDVAPSFLDKYVSHKATKKRIFDWPMQVMEETGKVINATYDRMHYDGVENVVAVEEAIAERLNIVTSLRRYVEQIKKARVSQEEEWALSDILNGLNRLEQALHQLPRREVIDAIEEFGELKREWQDLLVRLPVAEWRYDALCKTTSELIG